LTDILIHKYFDLVALELAWKAAKEDFSELKTSLLEVKKGLEEIHSSSKQP